MRSAPSGINKGETHVLLGLKPHQHNIGWQPEDSNSEVDDLIVEDTMNSISSVLRKVIEGKVTIFNPKVSSSLVEGWGILLDAKDEMLSTTSLGTS